MTAAGRVAGLLVAVLLAAGCTGGDDEPLPGTMTLAPADARFDQPVAVAVRGLPAGARTTVTATATDAIGVEWSASADFTATPAGTVSLDQPPLAGGSYSGRNPMGLFESMAPKSADAAHVVFVRPDAGFDVTLRAAAGGRAYAAGSVHRRGPDPSEVTLTELRPATDGVYGDLYLPVGGGARRPALLVLSGSGGGVARDTDAALLAARGYPSLSLAYFGVPGLPDTLGEIPLEYFARALAVLRTEPGVDPDRVYLLGASRGAEAALLVGAYFPDQVAGVVAGVPSDTVRPGDPPGTAAWTLGGRPLATGGAIPVARIRGPVLLACGGQDLVWPSCPATAAVVARLAARGARPPVTSLRYPQAGHGAGQFVTTYTSFTRGLLDATVGGTVAGTQAALASGQRALLTLLAS